MNEISTIINLIKEIGYTPAIILLILLFHFCTVRNLEKQNEKLLEIIIDLAREGKQND
ncbi:MAG: hypothetical protein HZA78_04140 [Candidatus Schekmanbacteria bacterium]|nr:hypothetical protein [Candidatus Schekmanbacteria bacterium]